MGPERIRRVISSNDVTGEGAVWHPGLKALFWTDINRGLLHCSALEGGSFESWSFDQPVTAVVLTTEEQQVIVVLGGRIVVWDVRTSRVVDTLFILPEWPAVRCNDARVDPNGTLWFGTMQNNVRNDGSTAPVTSSVGALYSLGSRVGLKRWYEGFGIVNTVAWSPPGDVMYFGDTLRNCIYRCSFDSGDSSIGKYEPFFADFPRGLPDGSAVDTDGFLWNCRYGGGCIVRVAPDGSVEHVLDTPAQNPTTCTFGAIDMSTLFFTSAEAGDGQNQKQPGAVFCCEVQPRGLLSVPFRL